MDVTVWDIFKCKLSATCPEVTITVPVSLKISIYCAHHRKTADIKLSVLIKEWLFYVFLYDIWPSVSIDVNILNKTLDMIKFSADLYPTSSVGILSRLDNPEVFAKFRQTI